MLTPILDIRYRWSTRSTIQTLFKPLVIPWVFWLVFYRLINIIQLSSVIPKESISTSIIYGTSPHLWFLPFTTLVLITLSFAKQRVSPKVLFSISVPITAALLLLFPSWGDLSLNLPLPGPQWAHAIPAVVSGLAVGLMTRVRYGYVLIFCGVFLPSAYLAWLGINITYCIGISLTIITVTVGPKLFGIIPNIQPITSCMFGVYLTHPFWISILMPFTNHRGYVLVTMVFTISFCTVYTLRRFIPVSRWVLG